MARRFRLLLLLLVGPLPGLRAQSSAPAWPDPTRVLPRALRDIPTGLRLEHSPTPCYPEPNTAEPARGRYVWRHQTTVQSLRPDELTVEEAGSFIWYDSTGWRANVHYNAAEFADRFRCSAARLHPSQPVTFARNNRYGDQLYAGDALWYVLARDRAGRLWKGIGLVETEATVRSGGEQ